MSILEDIKEIFFQNGFSAVFFFIIASLGIALLVGTFCLIYSEIRWYQTESFSQPCSLQSSSYKPSTLETQSVPVIGSNGGFSVGFVTTGDGEKNITCWNCGEYGNLVSTDKKVFRLAKSNSTLLLKKKGEKVRIVGIVE